jgi:hypothetical protein
MSGHWKASDRTTLVRSQQREVLSCRCWSCGLWRRVNLQVATDVSKKHTASIRPDLKVETVCSSETLVPTYKSTRRRNPEDQHRQPRRREDLESRIRTFIFFTESWQLLRATQPPTQWVSAVISRRRMKQAVQCDARHSPPSRTENTKTFSSHLIRLQCVVFNLAQEYLRLTLLSYA